MRRKFPEEPEPERGGEDYARLSRLCGAKAPGFSSSLRFSAGTRWCLEKLGGKRLAIMVEDHPLEYRTFEGMIAEGEYGAGEVIIWDQGTYTPLAGKTKDAMQGQVRMQLNQGALRFLLFGEKLRGEFALIRQQRLGEKAWLLIKKRDHYASDADVTLQDRSVITGKRLGEAK